MAETQSKPTVEELMARLDELQARVDSQEAAKAADVGPEPINAEAVERLERTATPIDEKATESMTLDQAAKLIPEDDQRAKGPDGKNEAVMDVAVRGDFVHIALANGHKVIAPKKK